MSSKNQKSLFSVCTNFDNDLLPEISKHQQVYEVYGKMHKDVFGGGRAAFSLTMVNKKRLLAEIKRAHQYGFKFNYLLNASCLDNLEYSIRGNRKLLKFIDFLVAAGVDTVTVAIPYLATLIKRNYPNLRIDVSVVARVRTIKEVEQWQALGVNTIVLDNSANKNFSLLKEVSKKAKCDIKLMVNEGCDIHCIYRNYHFNIMAHNSRSLKHFPIDVCVHNCKYNRTKNLENLIKAPWIRPEDLEKYIKIGINKFKITHRNDSTKRILRSLRAYESGHYDGNLSDIVNFSFQNKDNTDGYGITYFIRHLFKPTRVNLLQLYKLSKLVVDDPELYIDNQKLNGYLDKVINNDCDNLSCSNCGHCEEWARKVISYDPKTRSRFMNKYQEILDMYTERKKSLFFFWPF